jgi:heme-degrading monooxygenase HmoA
MYVAMTRVQLKPGSIDEVLRLFKETNPPLVKGQEDWIEAKFTANYEEDEVVVLAFWRDDNSYREFSSSDSFRQVMSQFAPYFSSPPKVTINKVLLEM